MQLPTIWLDVDINLYEWSTDLIDDIQDGYLDETGVVTYTLDDVYYWGGEVQYENYWDTCEEGLEPYWPWLDGERSDYDGNEYLEWYSDEPMEVDEFSADTDEIAADI